MSYSGYDIEDAIVLNRWVTEIFWSLNQLCSILWGYVILCWKRWPEGEKLNMSFWLNQSMYLFTFNDSNLHLLIHPVILWFSQLFVHLIIWLLNYLFLSLFISLFLSLFIYLLIYFLFIPIYTILFVFSWWFIIWHTDEGDISVEWK